MPGFYYRLNNNSKNWVVWHKGGGWCTSLEECAVRANTVLGSSKYFPKTIPFSSVIDPDPKVNPSFYDWNAIYIEYCDGSSFTSNNNPAVFKNQTLHFKGKNILISVRDELKAKFGMNDVERLIITGTSAGGLATYLHVDWWAASFPQAHTVALPDAGYFIDAPNIHGIFNHTLEMKFAWGMFNSSGGANDACVNSYPEAEQWKCFFAQYTYPHIKSPLFVWNSRFDSWQAGNILQLDCSPINPANKCNATQLQWLDNYGMEFMKAVAPVLQSQKDGYYLDACYYHTGSDWSGVLINKLTVGQAFAKWYAGGDIKLEDNCPKFPCNPTCLTTTLEQLLLDMKYNVLN